MYSMALDNSWIIMNEEEMYDVNGGWGFFSSIHNYLVNKGWDLFASLVIGIAGNKISPYLSKSTLINMVKGVKWLYNVVSGAIESAVGWLIENPLYAGLIIGTVVGLVAGYFIGRGM